VTFVTDITQQINTVALGEAQPWHLAVGQTCNTQGLEELRSPPTKLPGVLPRSETIVGH
jgi:hypothetical protein